MPRYETPSPSPPPPRRRKRAPSSSSSSQPSASASIKEESLVKTSLVFLGSIVAATFCAHKFWPKGVTYGDKEDWEIEQVTARIRRDLADEKRAARRRRPASMAAAAGPRDRDSYSYYYYYREPSPHRAPVRGDGDRRGDRPESGRYGSRDGRRRSYHAVDRDDDDGVPGGYPSRPRGGRERPGSRERDWERGSPGGREGARGAGRARERQGPGVAAAAVVVERRASSSRPESYYPPAPQRYSIAAEGYRVRPSSVGGYQPRSQSDEGYRSRPSSVESRRSRAYDPDVEPDYVYVAPRRRRPSVDGGRPRSTYAREEYI